MKMSKNYFLILVVSLGVVGTIWFSSKLATEAVVALAKTGSMRDSVNGNVQVFSESSFELRSQGQGKAEFVLMRPFGKPVEVLSLIHI